MSTGYTLKTQESVSYGFSVASRLTEDGLVLVLATCLRIMHPNKLIQPMLHATDV